MAKGRLEINFHENTIAENKSILLKLRGRSGKIDNKTSDEWMKLFAKLNSNNNNNNNNRNSNNGKKQKKSAKTSTVTRQDQVVVEPIYGPIERFPSGYWWGIRMDCSRDQVHSPFDKDIQDGPFGVASICTSHLNTTNDVDLGTLLTFTGDEYISGKLNDRLIYNYRNEIPLRVVRSYNLANEFAPKTGYRYDGLYIVISSWIGLSSNSKKYYKFALARLNCQEPPSWSLPSQRMSQRISSFIRTTNVKAGVCGSLRCHMYGCQTQEPERKRKKIIHTHETSTTTTTTTTTTAVNVSGVCLNKSPDVQRHVNESKIVIRHVSKKCDSTAGGHGINVHGVESPIQMGHLMQPYSSKPPVCELQNTNISIRTELYDSSPNPQQDIKKATPMTFCRIYKTNLTPAARMISSHSTNTVGTMNLNAFGPNMKDKMNQESQIQSRSGISKISDTSIVNAINCTVDNCNIKSNNSTPTSNIPIDDNTLEYSSVGDIKLLNTKSKDDKTIKLVSNTVAEEHLDKCLDNQLGGTKIREISSRRSSNSSISSTESLIRKLQLPEAVVTIETMTPEQMLDLIVKKRYNPTGKLLIESIIGLPLENMLETAEDSSKLGTNPSCDSHPDNNVKCEAADTRETTNEKQKLHEENYFYDSLVMSSKKIGNENIDRRMKFMRLKRARVANALAPIEDSNIKHNKNSSKRLNKTHTTDKIAQPFSKSTSIKKRRGELANLVIDANFSTKIRSHTVQTRTMSRQLRSPTIILRKRKEFKGFITNFARVDLSRKSKRLKGMKKTRIPKNRQIQKKKCEATVENIRRGTVKSIKPDKRMSRQVKQNDSMSQRDKISMQVTTKKIERSKSQMVDAMTQCTLQREISASVETQSHCVERNSEKAKIEWINLVDDVKCGSDNDISLKKIVCHNSHVETSSDGTEILQTIGGEKGERSNVSANVRSSTINNRCLSINNAIDTLSAFVPVNVSGGDIRVARLRSIGFKPIEPCLLHNKTLNTCNSVCRTASVSVNPTVIRRNVDEEYNKYTSEENNVVGYMDHELHYQDIEAEANASQKKNEIISKRKYTKVQEKKIIKNNKPNQRILRKLSRNSFEQETNKVNVELEEEQEPWLGWNSYVSKR